jgi:hypothetical protein
MLRAAAIVIVAAALMTHAAAADADNDGVPDDSDVCPGSVRGSDEHVDAHGCTHLQVDADLDGVCNPDRPRDANNRIVGTRDDWCTGSDNCKFVVNADQTRTLAGPNGPGDACNTGESPCSEWSAPRGLLIAVMGQRCVVLRREEGSHGVAWRHVGH